MLGRAVVKKFKDCSLIQTDLHNLDILENNAVRKIIEVSPDYVLHLAAYTDVDGCEHNSEKAYQTNADGTRNVALACKKLKIPLLHISTDYVFDGTKQTPYLEWDKTNPISVYGRSKEKGEKYILNLLDKFWIVRTSGLYGPGGKNFVTTIIKKASESSFINVVNDQIGAPTYTEDLASAMSGLIKEKDFGVYHITNSDWCSWYDFAKEIIREENFNCEVLPINSNELARPAKRPQNWRLNNFMWEKEKKKPLRNWQDALKEYIKNIKKEMTR